MKQYLLHIVLCLFALQVSLGQEFPVQVIPQTFPPNPVLLSDYANPSAINDRVSVQLILNDLTETDRQVRLRLRIEGQGIQAQSNEVVIGANPIFLNGGTPLILTTADLAPYFEFQNLQGITPLVYGNTLPEGLYQFCFEVFDNFTGNPISQDTCASFVLFSNEPPFLNLPFNASGIQEMDPLNIVFQWTPRHINVTNVQYEYTIAEIYDLNIDPQAAFLTSPPIFQTTTAQTTLIYDFSFPQLIPGKRYAWRVRAFALQGAEEIGLFENNGFSEIFYFDYQSQCDEPLFPEVTELSNQSAKIAWQGTLDHLDYTLRYREKNANSDWYDVVTPRQDVTVDGLNPETTYEYKIVGNCTFGAFGETLIYEFTTLDDAASAYQGCNIEPDPINIENQEILPQLFPNDVFTAGDFPVKVVQLTSDTAPFAGGGYVTVPWLGDTKIAVEFTGIQINTDMQLIAGVVETTYDADWGDIEDIEDLEEIFEGDNDAVTIEIDFDIEIGDIEINDQGDIVITDPETGVVIQHPGGDDVVIIDESGDVFIVDEEGNITEGGEVADGGPIDTDNTPGFDNSGNLTTLSAEGIKVTFKERSDYKYGFDKIPDNADARQKLADVYETITDADGNPYDIIHKAALKDDDTEYLIAEVTTDDETMYGRLEFKSEEGVEIPSERIGNTNEIRLTIKGLFSYENELIYATLLPEQEGGQQTIAGSFRLWHLTEKEVDITVVRVNDAELPNDYQQGLNDIYQQAAVAFTYSNVVNLSIDPSLYGEDTLLMGESGLLANYTGEQRNIIDELKSQVNYNPNTYYLLVFGNDIQPSRAVDGFMPLKRQYGFVFNPNGSTEENFGSQIKTMAHELGHGIFGLEHPFTQFETPEGATDDWLMDYVTGTRIPHTDWAQIHNPGFQLYIFQDDEDGESTIVNGIPSEFENPNGTLTFMTMNGSYITLPNNVRDLLFITGLDNLKEYSKYPIGALKGFRLDSINYKAKLEGELVTVPVDITDFNFNYLGFESDEGNSFELLESHKTYYGRVVLLRLTNYSRKLVASEVQNLTWDNPQNVNIFSEYERFSRFYNSFEPVTRDYGYEENLPFPASHEFVEDEMNDILGENINWNSLYTGISKLAVLNNGYPAATQEISPSLLSSVEIDQAWAALQTFTNSEESNSKYFEFLGGVISYSENCVETFQTLDETTSLESIENCTAALSNQEIEDITIDNKLLAISFNA